MGDYEDQKLTEKAQLAWDSDLSLREEFSGDFQSWAAFFRASAKGQIHILGSRKEDA